MNTIIGLNYNLKDYYYNNGQLIEEFEQYWNDSKEIWLDNYHKLYTYNSEGKLAQITHQEIYKGNYVNSSRELMEYNAEGKLQNKIVQKYDEAWTNFLKYEYYYLANDLLTEENLAYWENDNWSNPGIAFKYTYNENGNLTEKTKIKVSDSKDKNISREEFTYGTDNKLEAYSISDWNSGKKQWVNESRALYENSLNGYVLTMLSQGKKKREWVNCYFTEFAGNIEAFAGNEMAERMVFTIYPINFGDQARLEFTNPYKELYHIRIINENGQMVASAVTDKQEISLDARNLNKGLYFVELQGSNLYSGKFSIE